ncbi:MAG TPA: phage holin family protein [Pyrinomonadaceae bacterium]|jgi:hypothetical protein
MSDLEPNAAAPTAQTGQPIARLPELLEQLRTDLTELVDAQFDLLKEELKHEATAYARGAALTGLGGAAAAVGVTLLHVPQTRRVGALYLTLGAAAALFGAYCLRARSLVPARTVAELKKDAQLLGLTEDTEPPAGA